MRLLALAWSTAGQSCAAQAAVKPGSMRVRYKVVVSEAVDLRPQDCDSRKAVQDGSLSAVKAAFPHCDCFVWHEGCWVHIDDSTAELVADGSCLKVFRTPGE